MGLRFAVIDQGECAAYDDRGRSCRHLLRRHTRARRELNSLAFNLTGVDPAEDMGPFEIALGTQFDEEPDFDHGMFPPAQRQVERAGRRSATPVTRSAPYGNILSAATSRPDRP
jgi:hypothetical protein